MAWRSYLGVALRLFGWRAPAPVIVEAWSNSVRLADSPCDALAMVGRDRLSLTDAAGEPMALSPCMRMRMAESPTAALRIK